MQYNEPRLYDMDDYEGNESKEKRLTVWIVILSGLLIGSFIALVGAQINSPEVLVKQEITGIHKY